MARLTSKFALHSQTMGSFICQIDALNAALLVSGSYT